MLAPSRENRARSSCWTSDAIISRDHLEYAIPTVAFLVDDFESSTYTLTLSRHLEPRQGFDFAMFQGCCPDSRSIIPDLRDCFITKLAAYNSFVSVVCLCLGEISHERGEQSGGRLCFLSTWWPRNCRPLVGVGSPIISGSGLKTPLTKTRAGTICL